MEQTYNAATQHAAEAHRNVQGLLAKSRTPKPPAVITKPPVTALSDVDLVRRIGDGDRRAEALLVPRFEAVVIPVLAKLTKNPELREDLFQETFLAVLQRLRQRRLRNPAQLPGYIYRTALFLFYGELRDRNKRPFSDSEIIQFIANNEEDPGTKIDRRILCDAIKDAVRKMTVPRDRELIDRFYLCEHEKLASAASLNLTLRHFDRVAYRGKQRLGKILRENNKDIIDSYLERPM